MISHRTQLRDHDNAQADWADVVWWSYIADHYKVRPLEETLPTALAAVE